MKSGYQALARRVVIASVVSLVAGCAADDPEGPVAVATSASGATYQATVTRTAYGIPHIEADSWGSLGFGEAYAAAEDQVCNMALALVQAQGESAAVFGLGRDQRNLTRDIVIKALDIPGRAEAALAAQSEEIQAWLNGYTAGYNQYLAEHAQGVGSWCDQADWVRPVAPAEFMAQYLSLVQSLPRVGGAIASASLPDATASSEVAAVIAAPTLAMTLTDLKLRDMGSNAWALADARTEDANSLLLANPHYPWYGIARFWEKHLTIPGVYDAYGVGLIGTPGVSLGFNQNVAWSHTVSNSKRTVIYQLTLNPSDPTQYRWGDGWRSLSPVEVAVDVASDTGVEPRAHTVWFSHHGPLIALPGLNEDPYTVFAIRDANAENTQVLAQWQAMGQATGMDALIDAHRQFNAMPWVNTIAVSAEGRAAYIDNSTVGALSAAAIEGWRAQLSANPKLQYLYLERGLVILDGSQAANDWVATDAPIPETVPFEQRPLIESDAYVFNANDSYWLSDPANPAAALSPLYGATHSPRSVRTRMNMELLRPDSSLAYAGDDGQFSIAEVQTALFANDSLAADLLLPELLSACTAAPIRALDAGTVNLKAACEVLAAWDGTLNIESKGAVLFREWLTRYPYSETYLGNTLFAVPFDPEAPRTTPRGLKDTDEALNKLAQAVQLLQSADIPLDAPLGDYQVGHRMAAQFPIHGGNRHEGIANLQMSTTRGNNPTETPVFTGSDDFIGDSASLSTTGYNVVHGSSFIMTLAFSDDGPSAEAILSYSQSGNPDSPHFSDQTALYRDKRWREILFSPEDVQAGAVSVTVLGSND